MHTHRERRIQTETLKETKKEACRPPEARCRPEASIKKLSHITASWWGIIERVYVAAKSKSKIEKDNV